MRYLILVILALLIVGTVCATPHGDAVDYSSKISSALDSIGLPYDRTITMQNLAAIGYDVDNMSRPGTYRVYIKKASYNSKTGLLTLNINMWHNGNSLKINNPVHFYIPSTLDGTTNAQRLNNFIQQIVGYMESIPYGTPVNDDTLVVYPPSDGNGRAVEDTNADWSTMRGASGDSYNTAANPSGGLSYPVCPGLISTTTSDQYDKFYRGIFSFNTSTLPDDCTVTSVVFSVWGYDLGGGVAYLNELGTPNICITSGSLATNGSIATTDYDSYGSTEYTNRVAYTSFAAGGWNNFSFNSNGISATSKTGWTNFYLRDSWDVDNSFGGTWASAKSSYIAWHTTKTAQDPFLTIIYSETPVAAFSGNVTSGYPPFTVAFTDATTNSPDNWDWYFGDDSKDSDSQNPAWTVNSVIGNSIVQYDVKLYASNATCGGSWENKSGYIDAYPLTASFTANTTSGCAPLTVAFTDTTDDGVPTSWTWNFSGLSSSSTQNPVYTFENEGLYYVWLNASNAYSWDIQNSTELINVTSNCTTPTPTPTPTPTYSGGISIVSYGKDYILYDIGNNSIVSLDGLETIPNGQYLGYYDLTPGTEHIICDETGINCTGIVTKPDTYTVLLRYGAYLLLLALCIVCYKYPITAFPSFIYGTYLISSYLPNIGAEFIEYVFVGIILIMSVLAATVGWRKIS